MTQKLFAEDDRVLIFASDEIIEVPDDKVWVVSIAAYRGGDVEFAQAPDSSDRFGVLEDDSDRDSSGNKFTIHDGTLLNVGGEAYISGWEFEYSE